MAEHGLHEHRCPDCGTWWSHAGACLSADAHPGEPVSNRLCDLCWGMRREARAPAHERRR